MLVSRVSGPTGTLHVTEMVLPVLTTLERPRLMLLFLKFLIPRDSGSSQGHPASCRQSNSGNCLHSQTRYGSCSVHHQISPQATRGALPPAGMGSVNRANAGGMARSTASFATSSDVTERSRHGFAPGRWQQMAGNGRVLQFLIPKSPAHHAGSLELCRDRVHSYQGTSFAAQPSFSVRAAIVDSAIAAWHAGAKRGPMA